MGATGTQLDILAVLQICYVASQICQANYICSSLPLRPGSSDKGMGRICGRLQVQVPMGTKIYLSKK